MRHKKIIVTFAAVVILSLISACGEKYDDAVAVNDKFVSAIEAYISDMEKADDADAVADALNDFAAQVEKIAPEMKKIAEKYPELKDPEQVPEELKESQAQAEAVSMEMAGQMMKAMTHMRDEGVMAAQKRLQEAMTGLGS